MNNTTPAVQWRDEISGNIKTGILINSSYCSATDKWMLLVASDDAKFESVHATGLEVEALWVMEDAGEEGPNK